MRRSKLYGIAGSALFGVLLLVVLFFIRFTLMKATVDQPVVINLGNADDAVGAPVKNPSIESHPATAKHQNSRSEEQLVNQIAESPVQVPDKKVNPVKKPTPQEMEDNRKRVQEQLAQQAEAKRQADQQAKIGSLGSVFGKSAGPGSGDGQSGGGVKGNPLGKVGGTGNPVTAFVAGRNVISTPLPAYNSNDEGKVVVNVTVDAAGNVTNAYIASATTSNPALRNAAIQAAKKSKFSSGTHEAVGTITYRFVLK